MDRHRLGLIVACAVVLAGCGQSTTAGTPSTPSTSDSTTSTTTTTETAPVGYPVPVGERIDAPPGDYDQLELHVGDVVTVELAISPDRAQYDQEIIVLAEALGDGKYAFQAIAAGTTRIVTGEPPASSCDDGDESCDGLPAPPTLDITVTS